jgi:hypothetical protein
MFAFDEVGKSTRKKLKNGKNLKSDTKVLQYFRENILTGQVSHNSAQKLLRIFDENLIDFSPNFPFLPDHGEAFVAAEVGCSRNGGHRLLTRIDQVRVNLGRYGSAGER